MLEELHISFGIFGQRSKSGNIFFVIFKFFCCIHYTVTQLQSQFFGLYEKYAISIQSSGRYQPVPISIQYI